MPETILFPYPHPKSLGLILDPKQKATVLRVIEDSPASKAGFRKGDVILTLAGQPLLSIADVQWVLQQTAPSGAKVAAVVQRGERKVDVTLALEKGWRRLDDISWRSSSWGLRRMATGGLLLESLSAADRKKADLSETGMALRVKHVGQFGPHAAAKQAGFRQGDILVSFDGEELMREQDVFAHAVTRRKPGDRVKVALMRDGKKVTLTLPMQE
jgi:S1-C subfamily serine protease